MLGSATRRGVGVLIVVLGASGFSPVDAGESPYEKAISRAVRLLPRQPDRIAMVERDNQSRFRKGTAHVEAFVADGDRVVYLVRQGVTLQAALRGAGIYDYVLATIVWHEMAHIDGADEAAAQEAEEQLWMQFIVARRVDSARGMQYLALLRKRR